MQPYQLKYSPAAIEDANNCLDYLAYHLEGYGNPTIAEKFLEELENVTSAITMFPRGFSLCDDQDLHALGVHKAHFLGRYNYKIFFHIIDNTIIVDMICHDLMDYKTALLKRKK